MSDQPKDHNGSPLSVGDVVVVPCVITGLDKHGEFIDMALETRWPMYPGPNRTSIPLNSRQVLLVKPSESKKDSVPVMDVLETIKAEQGK